MNNLVEPRSTNTMNENTKQNSVYIGITAIVGGTCVVATGLIAIFSPENISVVPWLAGGLSGMGIALGYFASNRA